MIKSMTGFGRGTAERDGGKINVEIKSLNSRYFDIKFLGINIHPNTEEKIKRNILNSLYRGSVKINDRNCGTEYEWFCSGNEGADGRDHCYHQ